MGHILSHAGTLLCMTQQETLHKGMGKEHENTLISDQYSGSTDTQSPDIRICIRSGKMISQHLQSKCLDNIAFKTRTNCFEKMPLVTMDYVKKNKVR